VIISQSLARWDETVPRRLLAPQSAPVMGEVSASICYEQLELGCQVEPHRLPGVLGVPMGRGPGMWTACNLLVGGVAPFIARLFLVLLGLDDK
jgi:hypothetical protein